MICRRCLNFVEISDLLGPFRICLDEFECVWMRSDVFRCNRMHFGALESAPILLEILGFFRMISVIWDVLGPGGLTFTDVLRVGGLLSLGLTIGRSH